MLRHLILILISCLVLLLSLYFNYKLKLNTQSEPLMSTTDQLMDELKQNPIDPNSFSRPDLCAVTDMVWSAVVNFDKQTIEAFVDLTIEKKSEDIDELIVDTSGLTIFKIIDKDSGKKLDYVVSPAVKVFGSKLTIKLLAQKVSTIRISYQTSREATALQWLKPEQTAGKRRPYLFSQCEAIHCRSLIPCQDTPYVKTPYSASIRAPKDLVVLLSAMRDGSGTLTSDGLMKEYKFTQKIPIPSYLIAIVVGDLVSKQIGPRSHVWSEKDSIEKCAFEFADTEKMIATAESIVGPYVWGIYDLLILPPSFPYGGMENPCLTFVTPTLLAGDRSLVYVIAHEIAHSWTGNLVTNRNFQQFWLNEGFTTFLERKIIGRLSGGEAVRQFKAIEGLKDMKYTIDSRGHDNIYTKLIVDLRGVDPDEAFSCLPYEKGHTFLFYLEQKLGGPQVFEPFLKAYIDKFKYKSVDTNDFKTYLYEYFNNKSDVLKEVDWDAWLYSTGMPPIIPNYDTSLAQVCTALANSWISSSDDQMLTFKANDTESMDSSQMKEFLNQLLEKDPVISKEKVELITQTYGLRSNHNSEIRAVWLRLCLKAHWNGCVDDAIEFVTSQGRMKFVRPIFKALYDWEETRERAISTFKSISDQMMHISATAVAQDLKLDVNKL